VRAVGDTVPLILNPSARSAKGGTMLGTLRGLSDRLRIVESTSFETARALAREESEKGAAMVLVAGGDGTINAVIGGLAGSATTLGVFPTGTMNLFARELELPMHDLRRCWEIIEAGNIREVDLFAANGQAFAQIAGVGYDARIIEATTWERKKRFGPLSYAISAFAITGRKAPRILLETGAGERMEGAFALIGNGALYGPAYRLFRRASNQDGLLDVVLFEKQGFFDILRYVSGMTVGKLEKLRDVRCFQTASLKIESEGAVPVEVDGELAGTTPVEFRKLEAMLKVFAPGP
jgi:diacylglycerol kinase (ATP)